MQRSDALPVLKTLSRISDPFYVNGHIPWLLCADLSTHKNEAVVPVEVFTTTKAGLGEIINGILSTGEAVGVEVYKTYPNDDSEVSTEVTDDDDDVTESPSPDDDFIEASGKSGGRYWGRRMHSAYDKHLTGEWIISLKKTGRSEQQPYYVVRQLKKGTEISVIGNIPVANIHSLFVDSSGDFISFSKEDEAEIKAGKFVLKDEKIGKGVVMGKIKELFTTPEASTNKNGELNVDYSLSKFR